MNSYTVKRKFHFQTSRRSKKTIQPGEKPQRKKFRTPRVTKLMALAISFDQMLRSGQVDDMAALAHLGQVSRARLTQIMNLLLLAPDIQEAILNLPQTANGRDCITIRKMQAIALKPDWQVQQEMWSKITKNN